MMIFELKIHKKQIFLIIKNLKLFIYWFILYKFSKSLIFNSLLKVFTHRYMDF